MNEAHGPCTFTKFVRAKIIAGVDLISDALPFDRLALLVSWYRTNVCICLQRHTAGDNRAFDAI